MSAAVREFSVGVIGAGQITVNLHLPVLGAMDGVRVEWITDIDRGRAAKVGRAFGVPVLPPGLSPATLPETDVVLLAIPYGARLPYYEILRERRTALYVEKPFARTCEEHQRLLSWFPGVRAGCGLQRRSSGTVRFLRDVTSSRVFGPLRSMRIGHGTRGILAGSPHAANLGLVGGGILFEVGIHLLDAGIYALGAKSATLTGGKMIRESGFDLHTEATLAVVMCGGRQTTVQLTVSGLVDTIQGLECDFEQARVTFSAGDETLVVRSPDGTVEFDLESRSGPWPVSPYEVCHAHWSAFLESLRTGRPNHASASTSMMTTSVIENLYAID